MVEVTWAPAVVLHGHADLKDYISLEHVTNNKVSETSHVSHGIYGSSVPNCGVPCRKRQPVEDWLERLLANPGTDFPGEGFLCVQRSIHKHPNRVLVRAGHGGGT